MDITSNQQKLLAQEIKAQFNSPLWSSQRVGRITASKFKLVCNKVSDNFEVKILTIVKASFPLYVDHQSHLIQRLQHGE